MTVDRVTLDLASEDGPSIGLPIDGVAAIVKHQGERALLAEEPAVDEPFREVHEVLCGRDEAAAGPSNRLVHELRPIDRAVVGVDPSLRLDRRLPALEMGRLQTERMQEPTPQPDVQGPSNDLLDPQPWEHAVDVGVVVSLARGEVRPEMEPVAEVPIDDRSRSESASRVEEKAEHEASHGIERDVAKAGSILQGMVDGVTSDRLLPSSWWISEARDHPREERGHSIEPSCESPLLHQLKDEHRDKRRGDAGTVELEARVDRSSISADATNANLNAKIPCQILGAKQDAVDRMQSAIGEMISKELFDLPSD